MQGQTAPPYPMTPNQWYPQYPGFQPTPQGTTPQPQPQVQQVAGNLPGATQARRSRSTSPPREDDRSAKDMLKHAFREMIVEEFGTVSASAGTTSTSKSAKILNGVNQYSVRAYAGKKINEEVPDIFRVLDSNENMTTKTQALEDRLSEAQSANAMVRFTL